MFRKLILLSISSIGFFSGAIYAVGLGEYELDSGLNQPLKAEIKILSAGELSEHEVTASLASLQEFEKVGVERLFYLNNIRFETTKSGDGNIVVKLNTREPIKEPFLNFLIELNWPNGRMIREYTFLLDPPIFDKSTSSTIEQTQASGSQSQVASQTNNRPTAPQKKAQPQYSGATYGPVTANDTLWSIASKVRPDNSVSIHQTLVAIYRANPDAFANGNINNLMRGQVLNIPNQADVAQVPHRAALQDVVMQNRQWRSGGARNIVDNQTRGSASTSQTSEGRLSLAAPQGDDGDSSGTGDGQKLAQIENQLLKTQEQSATLEAENEELRARLADALSKLESAQESSSALDIEDTELAALTQSQALEDSVTEADDSAAEMTEDADIASAVDDQLTGEQSDDSAQNLATESDTEMPVAQEQAEVQERTRKPILAEVAPKEESFIDKLLGLGGVLWGSIIGVVVLIAMAVFWRMRQRMEEDDFQDDLVASAGAGSMDTTESFELPDVGDDMLVELDMDDESEGREGGGDDEEFDPIGEADIYIAYGKYEQAETLLLDAIEDNPIRSDLKVKLMECYAESEDKDKFDALAEEVAQAVDADDWEDAVNKLRTDAFSGGGESQDDFDLPSTEDIFGEDGLEDEEIDFDEVALTDEDSKADTADEGIALDEASADEAFDVDMDFGIDDEPAQASEAADETLDDEEFSLDESMLEEGALSGNEAEELEEEDFDIELNDNETDIDLDDSDDISLDLDDEEFSFDEDDEDDFGDDEDDSSGDEIATKLDLARAYIDMGDAEGAKEILSEVVSEGSEQQKQEAQTLIEKMD